MDTSGLVQYEFLRLKLSLMESKFRYRRRERTSTAKSQRTNPVFGSSSINKLRITSTSSPANARQSRPNSCHGDQMPLKVDDVITFADISRETSSQEHRRSMLGEAQKSTMRHETTLLSSSRPHSVIGMGLQALTSPMPLSAKDKNARVQMDHIPILLPLPSDRTFIPSPDRDNHQHLNTPIDEADFEERSQSVARQCCEIMGRSMCKTCKKLERRLLNRERAERECPHMFISQQNFTTTQMVKRLYPHLTDSEIQDKVAKGQIARNSFLSRRIIDDEDDDDDDDDDDDLDSDEENNEEHVDGEMMSTQDGYNKPVAQVIVSKKKRKNSGAISSDNPIFALTQLKRKLKGLTSTPLYFTDLKGVQAKILSGEVDRKKFLMKPPDENARLKSAVSTLSAASSGKSTLSKKGLKLTESLMPVFVSPRKVKIYQEPSYKAYYEPPLLSKRRQIPNPSFFAGSSEAYSLPERLPDIIEFADSKIKALERQGRSTSSMSFASNISEETFVDYDKNDPLSLSSSRKELEKSEKEGEIMLGESLSSSTPRTCLKSSANVIDENFAGEEEHAKDDNVATARSENVKDELVTIQSENIDDSPSVQNNEDNKSDQSCQPNFDTEDLRIGNHRQELESTEILNEDNNNDGLQELSTGYDNVATTSSNQEELISPRVPSRCENQSQEIGDEPSIENSQSIEDSKFISNTEKEASLASNSDDNRLTDDEADFVQEEATTGSEEDSQEEDDNEAVLASGTPDEVIFEDDNQSENEAFSPEDQDPVDII